MTVAHGQGVVEDLTEALLAAGADRIAARAQGEEDGVLAELGQAHQARLRLRDQRIHRFLSQLTEDLRLHAEAVPALLEAFDVSHGDERLEHAVDAGFRAAADRGELGQARAFAPLPGDEADEVEQRQRALDALSAGARFEAVDGVGDIERSGPAQEPTAHLDAILLAEVLIRIGGVVHDSIMARCRRRLRGATVTQDVELGIDRRGPPRRHPRLDSDSPCPKAGRMDQLDRAGPREVSEAWPRPSSISLM